MTQVPAGAPQGSPKFMIGTDMMMPELYLINTEIDSRVKVDLTKDPRWHGGLPLRTAIMPDGGKAYLSIMSSLFTIRNGPIKGKAASARPTHHSMAAHHG